MEDELERAASEIARSMAALGRRIERGDASELLQWVIPGQLAVAHRPLRYDPLFGGSGLHIPVEASPLVFQWAERIRAAGIASIISLMHDKELGYYARLDLGAPDLMEFLRILGFEVCRIPWEDPAHSRSEQAAIHEKLVGIRSKALKSFNKLPKPVCLLCSAGEDRSAPVAAFIRKAKET